MAKGLIVKEKKHEGDFVDEIYGKLILKMEKNMK